MHGVKEKEEGFYEKKIVSYYNLCVYAVGYVFNDWYP
jgi:hypothetical protein